MFFGAALYRVAPKHIGGGTEEHYRGGRVRGEAVFAILNNHNNQNSET